MPAARTLLLAACFLVAAFGAASARADADPYAALLAPAGACGAADEQLGLGQDAARQAMVCLTNFARTKSGLAPLQANSVLDRAGSAKLASNVSCGEFSHTPCAQPFPTVFADYLSGANGYRIGENIAWGTGSYGTPRQTMLAWLHSTGHRENILNADFRELGVGYLPGQTFLGYANAALWSQEFGTRTPTSAAAVTPAAVAAAQAPASAAPAAPQRQETSRPRRRRVHRSRH